MSIPTRAARRHGAHCEYTKKNTHTARCANCANAPA